MQTIIVSLIALVALAAVAGRLWAAFRPAKGEASCPSCGASGSEACGTTDTSAPDSSPLILSKSKVR